MRSRITQPLPGDVHSKRLIIKKRYASLFLPASAALFIMMMCGTHLRTLGHAPANIIGISIKIQNQYTTASQVTLYATFSDSTGLFILTGSQAIACDGVILPQSSLSAQLQRQPPGGAYRCIYTDEQGKTTPITAPVPSGTLAITSPAPGAVVPIPTPGAAIPIPTGIAPTGTVTVTPAFGPRPPEQIDVMTVLYTFPTFPQDAMATVRAEAACGSTASATGCFVFGDQERETGSYTLSDINTAYGNGFDAFISGPGAISLVSDSKWSAPVAVFQSLNIEYTDNLSIPIIWVSA